MPLIVEDGSALSNAESYLSVADANAYHKAMGNEAWAELDTSQKEQYLRRATRCMMALYRSRWKGMRYASTQALDWPRQHVRVDDRAYDQFLPFNVVPTEVRHVCAELALRASTQALLADEGPQVLQESVGPLSVTYAAHTPQRTRYVELDLMLAPYFGSSGSMMSLERA